jgi:hypothetical protein
MSTIKTNAIQTVAGKPILNSTGSILQVVQSIKTDRQVISGSSAYVDISGLSATITPSSSSNKILIMLTITGSSADTGIKLQCLRGATILTGMYGDAGGGSSTRSIGGHFWGGGSGGNSNAGANLTMMYLDSPTTTSATTYKIQGGTNSATAAYVNTTYDSAAVYYELRTASHITLFEVSG